MIHYGPHNGALVISYGDSPVLIARKQHELDRLALDCLNGKLTLPTMPEPTHIYDQTWLRRLASVAAGMAADMGEI